MADRFRVCSQLGEVLIMGNTITINDTLQLSHDQGFPAELDLGTHLITPYSFDVIKDKIFSFNHKPTIRVYKIPPVRNFFVQNINDKWVYWGLVHILSIQHDYVAQTTSGTFKIIQLFSPSEMRQAFSLIDNGRPELDGLADFNF
jgi:hypothetical protein